MPPRDLRNVSLLAAVSVALAAVQGCGSAVSGPREFTVPAGDYQRAFDETRSLLRDMDFALDRIDAAGGVVSTEPLFSRGLFEPWSSTQTGVADEWEDAVNMQARSVRVTFTQTGAPPVDPEAETRAGVWVTVHRMHRSGRRIDSEWVGGSTFSRDPLAQERYGTAYLVPVRRDEDLERRLADRLMEALGIEPPPVQGQSGTPREEAPRRRTGKYAW